MKSVDIRSQFSWFATIVVLNSLFAGAPCALGDDSGKQAEVDYVRDIKPVLVEHCVDCHGPKKQTAGLRLDTARAAIAGGDSGPAIAVGESGSSLLLRAVLGDDDVEQMPPKGPRLSKEKIELLRIWIDSGARTPADEVAEVMKSDHWAFQRPVRPKLPTVKDTDWPQNPIDYFVLARLESEGLQPSPAADRAILIRRVTLDLLGIPPSLGEVDAFVNDERPDAYERLVDRLLASPPYGERWGRHWLDVARYADSNGYTRDFAREIWKYRDWVIDAVNRDLPFDQFTIEQFAGDMLPDATLEQMIATGFHRNTLINEEGGTDPEQFRVDAVADRVETTGVAFLGLTLGCARCHEHKYDPIPQREYYQVFAFLNNCDEPTIDAPYEWQISNGELALRDKLRAQAAELEKQLAEQEDEFVKQRLAWEKTITPEQRVKLPGPLQAALDKQPDLRDDEQKKLVREHFKTTEVARQAFPLVAEIARLHDAEPRIPTSMVMRERSEPRETHIHKRGNFLDLGARIAPAVPSALHSLPAGIENPNRLDFARWLVAAENPLTPRVMMNRHWLAFFGRGIVETENDFGLQGSLPSHPELLDWLAVEFVDCGWNVKKMHRLIVTSATYLQSSRITPELHALDPANKLLARQSRFRLEAEVVRDSALAASGLVTEKIGGPSVHPPQPDGVFEFTQDPKSWIAETGEDRYRRAMYTFLWRSSPYPSLTTFDFPEANTTCTRRVRSNTPLQSLVIANDVTFMECARAMAARALDWHAADDLSRANTLFRSCFSRKPGSAEQQRLLAVLSEMRDTYRSDSEAARQLTGRDQSDADVAEQAAWTMLCRILMNLDEFITRE